MPCIPPCSCIYGACEPWCRNSWNLRSCLRGIKNLLKSSNPSHDAMIHHLFYCGIYVTENRSREENACILVLFIWPHETSLIYTECPWISFKFNSPQLQVSQCPQPSTTEVRHITLPCKMFANVTIANRCTSCVCRHPRDRQISSKVCDHQNFSNRYSSTIPVQFLIECRLKISTGPDLVGSIYPPLWKFTLLLCTVILKRTGEG